MILSDLLGNTVFTAEGERIGEVVDARLALDGAPDGLLAAARLYGLVVSPHSHSSFAGYERSGVNAPALVARFLAWRGRDSVLVLWADLASVDERALRLRPGATLYSPVIDGADG